MMSSNTGNQTYSVTRQKPSKASKPRLRKNRLNLPIKITLPLIHTIPNNMAISPTPHRLTK
ncbi:hypothetical protein X777_16365 [Ooceraea biroi]|uniref:Uncharacterized protein n=1 Tax=Ooceraea biroi TaxID=2015173 RepID=A0A026VUN4_OOCBI|nr:hypothetical protein X777_16365 [Ooceraea biroi]